MPGSKLRLAHTIPFLICTVVIAGCRGEGMDGTYEASNGFLEISARFEGRKVFFTHSGMTTEGTYTREGNTVKLNANGQNLILTLNDQGELTGLPEGMVLRKRN